MTTLGLKSKTLKDNLVSDPFDDQYLFPSCPAHDSCNSRFLRSHTSVEKSGPYIVAFASKTKQNCLLLNSRAINLTGQRKPNNMILLELKLTTDFTILNSRDKKREFNLVRIMRAFMCVYLNVTRQTHTVYKK